MQRITTSWFWMLCLAIFPAVLYGQDKYEVAEKVPGINSEYVETGPRLTPDGDRLYFFRTDHPDNLKNTNDIWYSDKASDGSWKEPVHMDKPLNCYGNNNVHDISVTGDSLLLHNQYLRNQGTMNGVSYTVRKDGEWIFPKSMKIKNYHNDTLCTFVWNPGADVMIMGIKQKDSRGKQDLYVSLHEEGVKWSEPQNLGDRINTPESEICAFISGDGKRLYFSSKGHKGKGGFDIFVSKRKDSTWLNWTEPENLGAPVNSAGDELYFFKQEPATKLVASDRGAGDKSDIYRFFSPELMVKGAFFSSADDDSIKGELTIKRIDPETKDTNQVRVEKGKGFRFQLEGGAKYLYSARAEGYINLSEGSEIDVSNIKEDKKKRLNITLDPLLTSDSTIKVDNIYFKTDKSDLLPKSYPKLKAMVRELNNNKKLRVEIQGHTDSRGTKEYNIGLSQDRAQSVVDYLVDHGIDSARLVPKGYGESTPVATNDTPEGRAKNRRVELKVLEIKGTNETKTSGNDAPSSGKNATGSTEQRKIREKGRQKKQSE